MHEVIKQEYAAIQRFIINCFDWIQPYFDNVPEDFAYPSVFFPALEMNCLRETVDTFSFSAFADILIFSGSSIEAFSRCNTVVFQISTNHYKIPVYDENGCLTSEIVRIEPPEVAKVEDGVYRIHIAWVCKVGFDEQMSRSKADNVSIDYNFM